MEIYDEAIKIFEGTETCEPVPKELFKHLSKYLDGKIAVFSKQEYEFVDSALIKAKKEHELLELYRKEFSLIGEKVETRIILALEISISELEEELQNEEKRGL